MATTTTNYGYNISEGTDLVNPLTDIFPNFTAIDGDLKSVSDEAITTATELKTGTVHALTRSDADREAIRFTATSNFTAGETFTVDGTQVTALTTSGEALTTGAYIIGSEVFCILKGTLLTMFVSQNITDADTLDGHDSTYFATDSDMTQAENDISALSTKVGTAVLTTTAQDCSGAINELNTDLSANPTFIATLSNGGSGTYDVSDYKELKFVLVTNFTSGATAWADANMNIATAKDILTRTNKTNYNPDFGLSRGSDYVFCGVNVSFSGDDVTISGVNIQRGGGWSTSDVTSVYVYGVK